MTLLAAFVVLLARPLVASPDRLDQARALHRTGQFAEALAAYRAVVTDCKEASVLAVARNNACSLLNDMADPEAALRECRAALPLRRGLGDDRGLARTYNNMGRALRSLGYYDEAQDAYLQALAINEKRRDVAAQVVNRLNLGELARAAGRYGDALRFNASAKTLAEQHTDEPWAARQIHIAQLNRGTVLEKLGAYREALEIYQALAAEVDGQDPALWARVQVDLGVIYRNLGDPLRAIDAFLKTEEAYSRLGDMAGLSNAKLNRALALHLNLGRLEEAEGLYSEALELARGSGDRAEQIQTLFYLGDLQVDLGRVEAAAASFGESLDLAQDSPEGRWSALYGLGRVEETRGDLSAAFDYFQRAAEEIEQVRSSLAGPAPRSGYFGDKRPIYTAAVRVLAKDPGSGRGDEALSFVQRAKVRQLLDSLGPNLGGTEPLTAEDLRHLARPGEVLLEYFEGEEDLYLWILADGEIRMMNLGSATAISERVLRVHAALAAVETPPPEDLAELSRLLLAGGDVLNGAESLRIAPDGKLFYLPFEILPDPTVSPSDRLLLDRLTVSYLPSASTLAFLKARPDVTAAFSGPGLVGFANPELPSDPAMPPTPASLVTFRYGLDPLPAAERELAAVSRILGGKNELHIGGEATEAAFRVAGASPIVHLATHTVVDERPGRGAVIVLTAGGGHDGLLHPEEISALDRPARLTVLASCRSALGEGGGALTSLTGAFLSAGSAAVVATLWKVDDATTAAFMEQFYHQLTAGHSAAEALRRAKLRLRSNEDWDRPGLWSAYVLVGDGTPVTERPGLPVWIPVLALLLGLGGLAVYRRRINP